MNSVYLLALVTLCQGLPLKTSPDTPLSSPNILQVTIKDPPPLIVSWNKVENADEEDPVVGYKVKLWEVENITTTKYLLVNGELNPVEEEIEEPVDMFSEADGMPTEILTSGKETMATFHNVKLNVNYEIRVQAYTKNKEGTLSDAVRVKLYAH